MSRVKELSKETEATIESGKTLLIFTASYCGPCRMMKPQLDENLKDIPEDIKVLSVSVEDYKHVALEKNVSSIPTFVYLDGGEEKWFHKGVPSKSEIEEGVSK